MREPLWRERRGRVRLVAAAGLVAVVAAGCSSSDGGPTAVGGSASEPSTTASAGPASPTVPASDTASPGGAVGAGGDDPGEPGEPTPRPTSPAGWEVLAEGFESPLATLADPRTDEVLVVEQAGRVRALDGTVVLDITDRVTSGGERGLLDVTVAPDGQRVFVHYSGATGITTLSSLAVLPDVGDGLADPDSETVLLTVIQPAANHNGGSAVFGPDGHLYLALGDGGGGNDQFGNADDLDTPLGAILRLDVDTDPTTALPAPDNPYVDGGGDARVWVSGVRNPWRITHDGQQWFIADVGQGAVEEVSTIPADAGPHDLGWPAWEGDLCRLEPCDDTTVPPIATWTHDDGACSIIGGAVASRPAVDDGAYFFTDLCDPRVWRLDRSGAVALDSELPAAALSLDTAVDGTVIAATGDGAVLQRTR